MEKRVGSNEVFEEGEGHYMEAEGEAWAIHKEGQVNLELTPAE